MKNHCGLIVEDGIWSGWFDCTKKSGETIRCYCPWQIVMEPHPDDEFYEKYKELEDKFLYIVGNGGYPGFTYNGSPIELHRYLYNLERNGLVTDHINRIRTDCRKENIRLVTPSQNARNKNKTGKTSKYYGVSFQQARQKYRASVRVDGKGCYLGSFETEEEAGRAYNDACYKYGLAEYANLNKL